MRHISNPGNDKEGNPLAQTEDVRVQFFNRDEQENIYVQGLTLQVPLNCGVFAKAAMVMGFFEHFDQLVAMGQPMSEDFKKLLEEQKELIGKFQTTLEVSRAKVKTQAMKSGESQEPKKPEVVSQRPTPVQAAGMPVKNNLSQKSIITPR